MIIKACARTTISEIIGSSKLKVWYEPIEALYARTYPKEVHEAPWHGTRVDLLFLLGPAARSAVAGDAATACLAARGFEGVRLAAMSLVRVGDVHSHVAGPLLMCSSCRKAAYVGMSI
jgi:hypothetical protein